MARTQQQVLESMLGSNAMQIAGLVAQLDKVTEELETRNKQLEALKSSTDPLYIASSVSQTNVTPERKGPRSVAK